MNLGDLSAEFIATQLVVAGAIWGAIRTDLAHMHAKIADVRLELTALQNRFNLHVERRSHIERAEDA